jgi:hypothetical protein
MMASSDFGFTRRATAERTAIRKKFGTSRFMDGAINAATAQERRIGSIDDRINRLFGDITTYDLECEHCFGLRIWITPASYVCVT